MDQRLEALYGLVSGAMLFVPVFVAIFSSRGAIRERRAAQAKRIAEYRNSPLSRLLMLNER